MKLPKLAATIKTLILALIPFLLHVKFSMTGGAPSLTWPPLDSVFPTLPAVAAVVLTWYELLVRLVPSAENNSLVVLLHSLLEMLVPNHAVAEGGAVGYHELYTGVSTDSPGAGGTGAVVA